MTSPTMFPWDKKRLLHNITKKASLAKKSLGQKCVNSFLAHNSSHNHWLWFFGGALTDPTLQFGGACGLGVGAV
jgi:hypothetical protein